MFNLLKIILNPEGFDRDDLDYPRDMLDELEKLGVDISGFSVAHSFEGTEDVCLNI